MKALVRAVAPLLAFLVLVIGAIAARAAEPTKVLVDTGTGTEPAPTGRLGLAAGAKVTGDSRFGEARGTAFG